MTERVFEYKRYMRDGSVKNRTSIPRSRNKKVQAAIMQTKETFESLPVYQQQILKRRVPA